MSPAPQAPETVVNPPPTEFVPSAVRTAGTEADRIQAEYIASITPPDPNAPPVVVVDPQEPVVVPAALVEPVTLEGNEQLPPPAEPGTPDAKWEHSYKSLAGRFKTQQQKDAKLIADLTSELTARHAQPAPAPQAPQISSDIDDSFTAEEIENFGDLTATISRIAEAKANKALAQVAPMLNQTLEDVAIQREISMRDWLNTQVNFEAVNVAPEFKTWLALRDSMSGVIRQELLNKAWLSADGPRVLAICNGFLAENPGLAGTPPVETPAATPAPQAPRQPSIPLESLAAPGRARVQTPVTPSPQKPVYTRQEIKDFYAAKNRGFYRGREAEAAGYEAEIILAGTENRII